MHDLQDEQIFKFAKHYISLPNFSKICIINLHLFLGQLPRHLSTVQIQNLYLLQVDLQIPSAKFEHEPLMQLKKRLNSY